MWHGHSACYWSKCCLGYDQKSQAWEAKGGRVMLCQGFPVLPLPKWTTSSWLFWHLCLCHNISKTVTELYYLPYLVMVRLTWHNEFIGLKAQCSLVPVSCLVTSLACFSQLPDLEHRRIDSLTDQEWMFLPEGMSMCHPVFQQMHFETQF